MQDLDLDELDQAVNKMMERPARGKRGARASAPVPERQAFRPDPSSAPLHVPEAEKASEESPVTPPPRAPEAIHLTVNRPMPRVPERRRMHPGAMDIIQPNTGPKAHAPSRRPGRMAADLHPTQDAAPEPVRPAPVTAPEPEQQPKPSLPFRQEEPAPQVSGQSSQERVIDTPQDVSDEVLASLSLLDEPKPAPSLLAQESKIEPDAPKKVDGWPDPLDFHDLDSTKHDVPEQVEPAETPPTLGAEPVSVNDYHEDAAKISNSPFVTTKVEKRPLGAFADVPPDPPKADLPEPAEAPVPDETTSKEEMASTSFESKHHLDASQTYEHDPADLRSMTIPPQYHTVEQKPKEDVHHVFDTKEYHAAPPHVYAHRKGNAGLVVAIVVLIVLIIAVAAVGYFMMTGTFDITKFW